MFEQNAVVLKQKIAAHAFIRPASIHLKPDGTVDIKGNLTLWNEQMKDFIRTPLWEEGKTPGYTGKDPLQDPPYFVFIPAPEKKKNQITIVMAHGGGFETRTGCEGINTAGYFHERGYDIAVLNYRLRPYSRLDSLADMQRAIRLLKYRARDFRCSKRIVLMGFSAGAMLSANCATHFDEGQPDASDPIEGMPCRPDAVVMGYGAFSPACFPRLFLDPETDEIAELFGRDQKERLYLTPENNLRLDSPPFFIWQTLSDDGRFSMNLAWALQDRRIPFELHIFDEGCHGLAMADGENDLNMSLPHLQHWGELCDEWLLKTVQTDEPVS